MKAIAVPESVSVWDRFVRVFHWSLVSCVLLDYFVFTEGTTVHKWLGYLACALVTARVIWGFIGSRYARFSDFWPSLARIRHHLAAMRKSQPEFHPGHNPLGALMMLALMSVVVSLGITGFLQTTDAFWGDESLQQLHQWLGDSLIAMAGLHAAAAILMGRREGVNLVGAMITGVKVRRGASATATAKAPSAKRQLGRSV